LYYDDIKPSNMLCEYIERLIDMQSGHYRIKCCDYVQSKKIP